MSTLSDSPAVLAEAVVDDIRTTPDERERAKKLRASAETGDARATAEAVSTLQRILANVRERKHTKPRHEEQPAPREEESLAWQELTAQLIDAKQEWHGVAKLQFGLGILIVPVVVALCSALALGPLEPIDAFDCVFLSLLLASAVSHSFFVLRVHQQARQAQERIVEKRVGMSFLRIALEDYFGDPAFEAMIQSGTQMFLGHHAAPTLPLGPDDLRAALQPLSRSKERQSGE